MKLGSWFIVFLISLTALHPFDKSAKEIPLKNRLEQSQGLEKVKILHELSRRSLANDTKKSLKLAEQGLQELSALVNMLGKHSPEYKTHSARLHFMRGKAYYNERKMERALLAYKTALASLDQLNREKLQAEIHLALGSCYFRLSDTDNAIHYYRKAEKGYIKSGDEASRAESINLTGIVYYHLAKYDIALEYFLKAVRKYEQIDNKKRVASLLNNIGVIHHKSRNFDQSEHYFNRSIKIKRELKDKQGIGRSYNNLASLYLDLLKYQKALDFYYKALEIKRQGKNQEQIASTLDNIGLVYRVKKKKEFKKALKYHLEAYGIRKERKDPWGIIQSEINLGTIYSETDNPKEAEKHLHSSLKRAKTQKSDTMIQYALEALTKHYKKQKQFQMALTYNEEILKVQDRIFNEKKNRRIAELNTRYQIQKKEQEIEILTKKDKIKALKIKEQQGRIRYYLIIAALLSLAAIINYILYRFKRSAEQTIRKNQEQLKLVNAKLEELARLDTLTGLSNRRSMKEKLEYEKRRSTRKTNDFNIIIADIDNFKKINDSYGHDAGDEVLVTISNILTQSLRRQDSVARWGGEEFLFLLPETDLEGGMTVAEKIREKIEAHEFRYDGQRLTVTMTFGICLYNGSRTVEECIKRADESLYKGKNEGKNRIYTDGSL